MVVLEEEEEVAAAAAAVVGEVVLLDFKARVSEEGMAGLICRGDVTERESERPTRRKTGSS